MLKSRQSQPSSQPAELTDAQLMKSLIWVWLAGYATAAFLVLGFWGAGQWLAAPDGEALQVTVSEAHPFP